MWQEGFKALRDMAGPRWGDSGMWWAFGMDSEGCGGFWVDCRFVPPVRNPSCEGYGELEGYEQGETLG